MEWGWRFGRLVRKEWVVRGDVSVRLQASAGLAVTYWPTDGYGDGVSSQKGYVAS